MCAKLLSVILKHRAGTAMLGAWVVHWWDETTRYLDPGVSDWNGKLIEPSPLPHCVEFPCSLISGNEICVTEMCFLESWIILVSQLSGVTLLKGSEVYLLRLLKWSHIEGSSSCVAKCGILGNHTWIFNKELSYLKKERVWETYGPMGHALRRKKCSFTLAWNLKSSKICPCISSSQKWLHIRITRML